MNFKNHSLCPKNESGLVQMIMMGEFIRQIWVNEIYKSVHSLSFFFFVAQMILNISDKTTENNKA